MRGHSLLMASEFFPAAPLEWTWPSACWSWTASVEDPAAEAELHGGCDDSADVLREMSVLRFACANVATLRPREEARSGQPSVRRQTLETLSPG